MSNGFPIQIGKLLVVLGGVLVVVGLLLMAGSRFSFWGLGKLPGDFTYRGKNTTFYFPLATCVVLSVVITLVLWLISHFTRH
jgi:ribose/xylose/arabinose/galactoside ABC-type transport system permease subunit